VNGRIRPGRACLLPAFALLRRGPAFAAVFQALLLAAESDLEARAAHVLPRTPDAGQPVADPDWTWRERAWSTESGCVIKSQRLVKTASIVFAGHTRRAAAVSACDWRPDSRQRGRLWARRGLLRFSRPRTARKATGHAQRAAVRPRPHPRQRVRVAAPPKALPLRRLG